MARAPESAAGGRAAVRKGVTRPRLLTQSEYARRRGVSKQAVARAVESGRIPAVRRGRRVLVDPATADAAWAQNTDRTKPRNSVSGDPMPGRGPTSRGNGAAPPAPGTLAHEGMRIAQLRARRLEREEQEADGRLVDAAAAEARFYKLSRQARDKLLAAADRLGFELVSIMDPRQMTLRLKQEFTRIAAQLAGEGEEDRASPGD